MKNQQSSFWKNTPKTHGGADRAPARKVARPVATKRPMHIVFKSSRATGEWSFLRAAHQNKIKEVFETTARRFNVRVHGFANVGNHIHAVIQTRHRRDFQNFLRVFTQRVMFLVTGARKGRSFGRFWDALAFSRIVEWGRDFRFVMDYIAKNLMEAAGIPRDQVDKWFEEKRRKLRQKKKPA